MKVLHQLFSFYLPTARLALFDSLLEFLQGENNDLGIGVLTASFYKTQFTTAQPSDLKAMLEHARDVWLPQTLDPLKNEDKFILEIVESLQASLSLFVTLVSLERKDGGIKVLTASEELEKCKTKYLEPIKQTVEAGLSSLEEE